MQETSLIEDDHDDRHHLCLPPPTVQAYDRPTTTDDILASGPGIQDDRTPDPSSHESSLQVESYTDLDALSLILVYYTEEGSDQVAQQVPPQTSNPPVENDTRTTKASPTSNSLFRIPRVPVPYHLLKDYDHVSEDSQLDIPRIVRHELATPTPHLAVQSRTGNAQTPLRRIVEELENEAAAGADCAKTTETDDHDPFALEFASELENKDKALPPLPDLQEGESLSLTNMTSPSQSMRNVGRAGILRRANPIVRQSKSARTRYPKLIHLIRCLSGKARSSGTPESAEENEEGGSPALRPNKWPRQAKTPALPPEDWPKNAEPHPVQPLYWSKTVLARNLLSPPAVNAMTDKSQSRLTTLAITSDLL